jgi:hypothetical protein
MTTLVRQKSFFTPNLPRNNGFSVVNTPRRKEKREALWGKVLTPNKTAKRKARLEKILASTRVNKEQQELKNWERKYGYKANVSTPNQRIQVAPNWLKRGLAEASTRKARGLRSPDYSSFLPPKSPPILLKSRAPPLGKIGQYKSAVLPSGYGKTRKNRRRR